MTRKLKGILPLGEWQNLNRAERRQALKDGYRPQMAGGALESNINGLWVSIQTGGRGSPADMGTGVKKCRWVGGDLQANRADGTEPYSDGTMFGDTVDFVNTLEGNGAPVIQGQSGLIAYLTWLAGGQESVNGDAADCQQTISSTAVSGTFDVSIGKYKATISATSTNAQAQTALLAAKNPNGAGLPAGCLTVSGGPLPGTPLVIHFTGLLAKQPVPLVTIDNANAVGGTATRVMTVTGKGYTHTLTPSDNGGFYSTWAKSVGKTVIARHQFNDCRITTLRWEGSSASKVVKVTPTFVSFDPGQILAVDPSQADDGTIPFVYTEGSGSFTLDGQVYRGHSAFAAESQWALTPWFGDDVMPYDVVSARATLVLQGITILLDTQGLQRYNCQMYDTPTPATNAKPLHGIAALGSYTCKFSKTNRWTGGVSEAFQFDAPHVKWDPNLNIPANPAGGPVELPMAAEMRKDPLNPSDPAWRVTVTTPYDAAFTGAPVGLALERDVALAV